MMILTVKNLSKLYVTKNKDELKILNNINFEIKKGECFVIIGPNGSGKTTLLRILALLENPTKGKIEYNGKDITNLSRKKKVFYRRIFSFVRQKPVVRDTSVFNNIAFGLRIRKMKYYEYHEKTNKMIEIIGLKGMEKKNARSLSGGEMQRVAIAMNFILNSELYFLDEITANLDSMNVKLLNDFITQIKKDKEKTIIMSTHDRYEAIKFADRIAVLTNGTISQIGTPEEVFKSPKDEFTAHFVGYENVFTGVAKLDTNSGLNYVKIDDISVITSEQKEGKVKIYIHPESIIVAKKPPGNVSSLNLFGGTIEEIRELGNICHVIIKCGTKKFLSTITEVSRVKLDLHPNSKIYINFKATDVKCL